MSYLDKLLEGVVVKWKPLANNENGVAELSRGRVMSKEYFLENAGEYPVYSSQTANNGEIGKIRTFDYDGETLTWTTDGANAGTIFYRTGKFSITNVCGLIKIKDSEELNYKFLFYWLSIEAKKHVYSGMGNPKLMSHQMEKIQIPIPPLEVQKEIVRILDTFTELTAELTTELTTELTARKKQYNYYRDELLSFDGLNEDLGSVSESGFTGFKDSQDLRSKVEWKSLGEVCLTTNNIRWKDNDNTYRYIDLTSVSRDNNSIIETAEINAINAPSRAQKIVLENDVIFATTRPTQQRLCLIDDKYSGQIASTGYCVLRAKCKDILPKWIFFHLTSTNFKNYVEENQSGSAYPAISDAKVKEFKIPLPSLEEQERIVSILDKFDTLTTSISEGLPKEIVLRKKQYEYYRNRLLDFS